MRVLSNVLFSLVFAIFSMCSSGSEIENDYFIQRQSIMNAEKTLCPGGSINLTLNECKVNELILSAKDEELKAAYTNSSIFLPSQHFFGAKNKITQSKVFSIINKLPKACSLHTHMLAGVSVDFIMEKITYRDHLYGCYIKDIFKLRFLESPGSDLNCSWRSLDKYRTEEAHFDRWLRQQLTLEVEDPIQVYPTPESVWYKFKKTFSTIYDMICYRPVFEEYITELLDELFKDNVMYVELRGTFMPIYELDGTIYDKKQFFKIFISIVNEFKVNHPGFLGVGYIHSIYRGVTPEVLKVDLDELINLQKGFPNFIVGFDFVGFEEEGHQLVDFHKVLLEVGAEIKFFFHAGETNWYGHTDLNLIDAVLLNTSRIGHGFALLKHPVVMEKVKNHKIPVEVCPISNQVLMLNNDPRNHPAVYLIANEFPIVICNDDPAVWGATGLSYDWYIVFMAMTSKEAGIETLKQFAINSISYSAMSSETKRKALVEWEKDWEKFIDVIIKKYN